MVRRKRVTKEELIERALEELKHHERPILPSYSCDLLAKIDAANLKARRQVLERLVVDVMIADEKKS